VAEIEPVAPDIYLISTRTSHAIGEAGFPLSSVVYYIASSRPAIIDIGPSAATSDLLEALRRLGGPSLLRYAILTHVHMDHAGGAGSLVRQVPQIEIVAHLRGAKHLADPVKLIEASKLAFGDDFEQQYGIVLPVPEGRIRAVDDGDVIDLGNRTLKVVYAPGHATHHVALWDEANRALFCGEALGRPQSTIVAPVAGFDPDQALQSIERLKALGARTLFFPHGGVSRDADPLFASVRANMIAFRELILRGLKAGESRHTIAQELRAYLEVHSTTRWNGAHQAEEMVDWDTVYFKRKGILPSSLH
jgi:glyoxylase-like metal-dependent hydrolase (beta-lactamase superfamily II)